MCGRYSVGVTPEELEEIFEAPVGGPVTLPRWNVAPTQNAPVVLLDRDGRRVLRSLRWGLVPSWAESSGGPLRINARAESAGSHGAFREAFARRRCLVPADGFYEWTKSGTSRTLPGGLPRGAGSGRKQPWWIHHARGGMLALAGLWEDWRPRGVDPVLSFTILTTEPNAVVAPIHSRMPVVIPPEAWSAWLDPATPRERLDPLLGPAPEELLIARAVSPLVSRSEVDDPRCVEAMHESGPESEQEPLDLFEGR